MIKQHPIENIFKVMCEMAPRNECYYEKYIVFKNILFTKFYPNIPSKYPKYTNHSYPHIQGVLLQVDRLCKHRVNREGIDDAAYISVYELYLLLMSVIFHDVAMLVESRKKHSDLKKIIDLFDSIILSEDEKEWIKIIVKCHQSSINIMNEIPMHEKLINNWPVRPQFIASVLRLADELDENKNRPDQIGLQLKYIKKESMLFHKFADVVDGINPQPEHGKINIEISIPEDDLFKVFEKGKENIEFIQEVIKRISKMNTERQYCMGFTACHLEYKSIDLKLFIKGQRKTDTIEFTFDDKKGENDFWDLHKKTIKRHRRK